MYSWSAPSNHAGSAAAAGSAGGAGATGPPGSAAGVGLGGGAGTAATGPTAGPHPRLESPGGGLAAQSASSSSYQMPHSRWLPSLVSRSSLAAATAPHTAHTGHPGHTTLPHLSANLRMGTPNSNSHHLPQQGPVVHPHHNNAHAHAHAHPHPHPLSHQYSRSQAQAQPHGQDRHAGASVVVDASRGQPQRHQQQHAESIESSDSEQSDGGHREGRGGSGGDGSGDADYTPSPGEDQSSRRDSGRRRRDNGRGGSQQDGDGMSAANPVLIDNSIGDGGDAGSGGGAGNDTARKHGKRLTTKEEVSLFDICNRRAEEFGQRSNLCNWWRTVTAEFTQQQGHPYSWHSVRRKVELVTKQRMKFLVDQREKGNSEADDMSNPRWRAAVDAWIPTWQRWEDAEARRIEKRDSRRPRKRKDRSWESSTGVWDSSDGGWKPVSGPLLIDNNRAFASPPPQVRLPPGFDSMFTTPNSSYGPNAAPASSAASGADNTMMSAMLETLGKLNKHLDTVHPDQQSASPLAASLAGASNQQNHTPRRTSQQGPDGAEEGDLPSIPNEAISRLKDELRQELRKEIRNEMEKDRAAFDERLESVQRTQEMILDMLRQEPA